MASNSPSTTTLDDGDLVKRPHEPETLQPALVLAWSESEPNRVGEVLLVEREPAYFGRISERIEPRLSFVRQRPRFSERAAALTNPFLSRRQLKLSWVDDEAISMECLGKRALVIGGTEVPQALVQPGDVIELRGLYLFVCVLRPRRLESCATVASFGQPDENGVVGESRACWELRRQIAFAAERAAHVLISGASGTGKELVARGIHAGSTRRDHELVARNAATLPSGLIDAELFGNIANYPNVGMPERPGLIGQANGSTLFLDEIGELGPELQAHLLRVLDAGEYQRLGDARSRMVDLRLVAATNRPIAQLKHDLAARLTLRVDIPGLDDRIEDVPLLARHIVQRIAQKDISIGQRFLRHWNGRTGEPRFEVDLIRSLLLTRYTAHVRQLEALLWRSLQTSQGDVLELTREMRAELPPRPSRPGREIGLEELTESLKRHGGVRDKVWRELGLSSRHALHRLMKKLGVDNQAEG
ncbi:MAG TPA: sigma 54-interacting transcriptional regulator [Polyangiaceae bacterium]|nr:sigma 54-interacting transcriptional regulator [Polyangiaceae bacterium]